MKMLSIHRPRPSIEMRTPAAASAPVNSPEVNWLPWSVLKISGLPNRASACSKAATQNDTSIVFDRPSQHHPAAPIHDRDQGKKASPDRDVGVSRPEEFPLRPLAEPDVNL